VRGGGLERRKRLVFDLTFWRVWCQFGGWQENKLLYSGDRAGAQLREVKLVAVGGRFDFVVIGPRFVKSACRSRAGGAKFLVARIQAIVSLVSTGEVVLESN
jgi:hypothetical protein